MKFCCCLTGLRYWTLPANCHMTVLLANLPKKLEYCRGDMGEQGDLEVENLSHVDRDKLGEEEKPRRNSEWVRRQGIAIRFL